MNHNGVFACHLFGVPITVSSGRLTATAIFTTAELWGKWESKEDKDENYFCWMGKNTAEFCNWN